MELERQTAKGRWLRADIPPSEEAEADDEPKKRPRSHFVEPYRFEGPARAELMQTLQATGLGDESSRRLFVAALEFEIGNFLQEAAEIPQPDTARTQLPPSRPLERIGQAAATLARLLETAESKTREALTQALGRSDRYGRGYDQRYLQQLQNELECLQQACALEPPAESHAPVADRRLSEPFVVSLAETYRECFEIQPTSAKTGPFSRVARKILELTGLPVHFDQKLLKAALAR